jgi:ADP-heptose:LPS heptosyltransferase
MLCAVPALRALRRTWPGAEIVLLGMSWAKEFAERFSIYLDRFVHMPGYPGLPEQDFDSDELERFLRAVRAERFDLLVQMHGDGSIVNQLVLRMGALQTAGFFPPAGVCPDPGSYIAYPEGLPEPLKWLQLARHLGAADLDPALDFPLGPADYAALPRLPGPYVVLHPGAQAAERRWPRAAFAEAADALAADGLAVVLTGTQGEAGLTREVAQRMRRPSIDLCGKTDIGRLAALVSGAEVVVCNDTGVSHVAAAVRTPSVIIGRASQRLRWAPLDASLHAYLEHEPMAGAPVWPSDVARVAVQLAGRRLAEVAPA